MGLLFTYGTDKIDINTPNNVSRDTNTKRLTSLNRHFLQSLGLTVLREHPKRK